MVEGKWLENKEKNKDNERKIKDYEDFGIDTRLVTYDEEKDWVRREKEHIRTKEKVILIK